MIGPVDYAARLKLHSFLNFSWRYFADLSKLGHSHDINSQFSQNVVHIPELPVQIIGSRLLENAGG